jgi:DNA-binding response OmpR family regulator
MSQSILLASRDDMPLRTRTAILRCAGYRTSSVHSLPEAKSLSLDLVPDLIILGHSFSDIEQAAFIEELHESHPGLHVLCLKYSLVDPAILLTACKSIFSGQPGCTRVRSLRAS